ncbi:hypothetical protein ABT369_12135 [Dactylosporangium sp. NPDC000244]|uniref:hypothetical protein n=1 Tax=Dactylosporangium sp. NPDC000244 TaxID=3154365 RepID=UPI00332279F8
MQQLNDHHSDRGPALRSANLFALRPTRRFGDRRAVAIAVRDDGFGDWRAVAIADQFEGRRAATPQATRLKRPAAAATDDHFAADARRT